MKPRTHNHGALRRTTPDRFSHSSGLHTLVRYLVVVAIGLTIGWSAVVSAASIKGVVVDIDDQPLSNVMVTATNLKTDFGGVSLTDKAGEFALEDLPLGSYRLVAERAGHLIRAVTIELDSETIQPLRMTIAPIFGGQPSSTAEPRPKNYATVSVLYGTDRKPNSTQGAQTVFGAKRGKLVVGVCEVSIPRDHRVGDLESPALWKLEFRPDPSKHVALLSTVQMDLKEFRALLQQNMAKEGTRSALVFIHGYNVSFEDAARRTAQIAYDLKPYKVVPSFYSWPSNGKTLNYFADGEQAHRAVRYLTAFLELVFSDKNVDEVHLIAHSMGNRVLTAALQQLASKMPATGRPRIGQIALVAPDIDAEVFQTEIAPQIVGVGRRLTLYASDHDEALQLSKKLHKYPRAGDLSDAVTIVRGMDTVDVSAVDTSFVGHSYFADNRSVISDLFALLQKDESPSERFGMRPITSGGLRYWQFSP